jgi:hypothetical protein
MRARGGRRITRAYSGGLSNPAHRLQAVMGIEVVVAVDIVDETDEDAAWAALVAYCCSALANSDKNALAGSEPLFDALLPADTPPASLELELELALGAELPETPAVS